MRHRDRDTHQLGALSALVVGEEAEPLVAVTFEEDHASRRAPVSAQTERSRHQQRTRNSFGIFRESGVTYLVAVAMHMALASPISGHFVA